MLLMVTMGQSETLHDQCCCSWPMNDEGKEGHSARQMFPYVHVQKKEYDEMI